MGDKITVRLTRVNPLKGENDFEIVDQESKEVKVGKGSPWRKKNV